MAVMMRECRVCVTRMRTRPRSFGYSDEHLRCETRKATISIAYATHSRPDATNETGRTHLSRRRHPRQARASARADVEAEADPVEAVRKGDGGDAAVGPFWSRVPSPRPTMPGAGPDAVVVGDREEVVWPLLEDGVRLLCPGLQGDEQRQRRLYPPLGRGEACTVRLSASGSGNVWANSRLMPSGDRLACFTAEDSASSGR